MHYLAWLAPKRNLRLDLSCLFLCCKSYLRYSKIKHTSRSLHQYEFVLCCLFRLLTSLGLCTAMSREHCICKQCRIHIRTKTFLATELFKNPICEEYLTNDTSDITQRKRGGIVWMNQNWQQHRKWLSSWHQESTFKCKQIVTTHFQLHKFFFQLFPIV